ncbi:MAG: hypothetical protein L6R43_00110 [Planctomycetes bacterium]|nr:hypothetical protein [Planctomycetota bacterium]MCK6530870.1 hypothetical protein [Myxococcota bacterium]
MALQVISRFFHRATGRYVDPGQDCPLLPAEDVRRLVRARCLAEVPDAPPASQPPAPRKPRAPRQEAPPPPQE